MAIKSKKVRWTTRERKKMRIRKRIVGTTDRVRLSVFRSSRHMYAQVISDQTGKVLISASTLQPDVQSEVEKLKKSGSSAAGDSTSGEGGNQTAQSENLAGSTKSVLAARAVGLVLARRGKSQNISQVVFDRNGYVYHGRVKALADGAREGGFEF